MDWLGYIIFGIIILIVIFLICRELNCWYWKINERRDILESINFKTNNDKSDEILNTLKDINSKLSEIIMNSKTSKTVIPGTKCSSESPVSPKPTEQQEEITITRQNGRTFAVKNDGKYRCPKCLALVTSDVSTSCMNCGHSFME